MKQDMEEFYKEIDEEYKKIDKKWLDLHFHTLVVVIVLAFLAECVIGLLMYFTGEISTTIPIYMIKFLIIPSILNFFMGAMIYRALCSNKLSQEQKIYITSITYVIVCFVLFTIHSAFTALYFIFAFPILLTTIYVKTRLTKITSIISIVTLIISELCIKWDNDKPSIMNDGIRLGNFIIAISLLIVFSSVCMLVIRFEKEKSEASRQKEMERYKLQKKLQIDELTGVYNRIGFRNAIQDMEEDISGNSYIFVMIDIDNFKRLNDSMGHVTGDCCLENFGKILKENCKNGIPFRYGGDEFGVIFRNCTLNNVINICEQIQKEFALIEIKGKENLPLTISIGIDEYKKDMKTTSLIAHTDKALYESKVLKNKITVYKREASMS